MPEDTYCYAALLLAEILSLGSQDRLMHTLPVQRGAGLFCWGGIASGALNRIQTTRSGELAKALKDWDASGTFVVSAALHALAVGDEDHASLPNLRTLYYASGPVTRTLKEDVAARFGQVLVQDYGLTEVPEPLTVFSGEDHAIGSRHPALESVGRPVHRGRVKVAQPASADAPAVVLVRSPWMFSGYWRNGVVEAPHLRDGWLATDDLGYFDAAGYLHLRGRASATVRGGGVAFQLSEILSLVRAVPQVLDARGRVIDDDRFGEAVVADVVLAAEGPRDEAKFRQRLRELASDVRMVPAQVRFVSSLDPESVTATAKDTV
jgi:fatty-acyl-CoA synthase